MPTAMQIWAQGKHPQVAVIAIPFASIAKNLGKLIEQSKNPRTLVALGQLAQIPLDEWLSYYTRRRRYQQLFVDLLGSDENLYRALSDDDTAQAILTQQLHAPLTEETAADALIQGVSGKADPFMSIVHSEQLSCMLVYMIQVALPCHFLYMKPPGILFREAQQGNLDALEKLLRLDSSTLFDRKIARRLHHLRYTKPTVFAHLLDCANKPTKRKVTVQKFKVFVAGGLSFIAQQLHAPLTESEIRGLFDAAAFDLSSGACVIDEDLPESPEALAKAIQREVAVWRVIFNPDKK